MSRSDHWLGNIQICKNVGDWINSTKTLTTNKNFEVLGANIMRNRAIRTIICSHRDWAPKSWSRVITTINQLRATAGTRNIWKIASQVKSCAKPKAKIYRFQSTSLEVDPSNNVYQKGLWIRPHSKHVTKILRHANCHESDGIVRWDNVLTNMPNAEQTQNWDKEKLIDALWTKNDCLRPCSKKSTAMVPESIQLYFLCLRNRCIGKNPYSTRAALVQIFNNLGEWSLGKKVKSEKHETSLFRPTSKSARFVIETADHQLDKTNSWTKNGIVHANYRPDHDCV